MMTDGSIPHQRWRPLSQGILPSQQGTTRRYKGHHARRCPLLPSLSPTIVPTFIFRTWFPFGRVRCPEVWASGCPGPAPGVPGLLPGCPGLAPGVLGLPQGCPEVWA